MENIIKENRKALNETEQQIKEKIFKEFKDIEFKEDYNSAALGLVGCCITLSKD